MKRLVIISLASAVGLWAHGAMAQYSPNQLGEFKDWTAWVDTGGGGKSCFISSKPQAKTPKGANRGDVVFYVTHRPASKTTGEVAVRIGYPFAKGKEGIIRIGGQQFGLKFEGQLGWPVTPNNDPSVVKAMKAGSKMTIEGLSSRGTKTRDTYSLLGFTAAYNAISKACK